MVLTYYPAEALRFLAEQQRSRKGAAFPIKLLFARTSAAEKIIKKFNHRCWTYLSSRSDETWVVITPSSSTVNVINMLNELESGLKDLLND